jgi:CRP/FNR family transcriptional regulator
LCLPAGLDPRELEKLDDTIKRGRPIRRGDYLYRSGSALHSLYAIRTGFMKSCVLREDGRQQIAGFHMMGDLMGLDAISSNRHTCDAVALEDSDVCEIPLDVLEQLARDMPSLQQHFHRILSREIVRDHGVMLLLGSMRAEERLAAFLLSLSQRFAARGYSPLEFYLRMTREEIGSYLGLKLETISRALSRFHEENIIELRTKHVKILDMNALRGLISQHTCQS